MDTGNTTATKGDRLSLRYLYGGMVVYQPGEELGARKLTDFELVLIVEGNVVYQRGTDRYDLAPGGIIFARPGPPERYLWDTERRTTHAYLHFDVAVFPHDWPDFEDWPLIMPQPEPVLGPMFRHILHRALRHRDWPAKAPGPSDCRFVEAFLDTLLNPPVESASPLDRDRSEPVRRALKWMREVLDEDPSRKVALAHLAEAAHVTGKHLCRTFSRELGIPPLQVYRLLRLQLAVALLARSNLDIKEIASRCGFGDPLYFSRCFSRTFGMPPREARRRMDKGEPPPPNPLPLDLTPRLYW